MTVKNHSEVVKGSRHAPHNLEYGTASAREAGTGEASGITLTSANLFQVARQTDDDSFWILLDESPITWVRLIDGTVTSLYSGEDLLTDVQNGGIVSYHTTPVELADDEKFNLPQLCGYGRFLAGPTNGTTGTVECLHIAWQANGTLYDLGSTSNTALTDSDTFWCAYDDGTTVAIKNRLGATKWVIFDVHVYQPSFA